MPESFDDYYNRRMRQLDREQHYNNLMCWGYSIGIFLGTILAIVLGLLGFYD